MAVVGKRVTVTDAPTRIDSPSSGPGDPTLGSTLLIHNRDAAASIFLGDAGVTAAEGFELQAGVALPLDLGRAESLYAIAASGSVTCHVLEVGV